jgi:hypothetical protein
MRLAELDARLDQERLIGRIRPTALAHERVLPVLPPFEQLVPWGGLKRGATISVSGRGGAVSLALALVAGASAAGSWSAGVGLPSLGLGAVASLGVAFDRFVVVEVDADDPARWPTVVADLVEAFDVVVGRSPRRIRPGDARRLAARVRERGAVMVQVEPGPEGFEQHGLESDLRLAVSRVSWHGLGEGHGSLRARRVTVETSGRRDAARPRRADLWLPDHGGAITLAAPDAPSLAAPHPELVRAG